MTITEKAQAVRKRRIEEIQRINEEFNKSVENFFDWILDRIDEYTTDKQFGPNLFICDKARETVRSIDPTKTYDIRTFNKLEFFSKVEQIINQEEGFKLQFTDEYEVEATLKKLLKEDKGFQFKVFMDVSEADSADNSENDSADDGTDDHAGDEQILSN